MSQVFQKILKHMSIIHSMLESKFHPNIRILLVLQGTGISLSGTRLAGLRPVAWLYENRK
jgi:hypothetical protein